jgi:hypothetical protein
MTRNSVLDLVSKQFLVQRLIRRSKQSATLYRPRHILVAVSRNLTLTGSPATQKDKKKEEFFDRLAGNDVDHVLSMVTFAELLDPSFQPSFSALWE